MSDNSLAIKIDEWIAHVNKTYDKILMEVDTPITSEDILIGVTRKITMDQIKNNETEFGEVYSIGLVQNWTFGAQNQVIPVYALGSYGRLLIPTRSGGVITFSTITAKAPNMLAVLMAFYRTTKEGGGVAGIDNVDDPLPGNLGYPGVQVGPWEHEIWVADANHPIMTLPFTLVAAIRNPKPVNKSQMYYVAYIFTGCILQGYSFATSAGAGVITENATVQYRELAIYGVPVSVSS